MRWNVVLLLCALAAAAELCAAHDDRPDPPPKHGGVVFTSGTFDVEAVLQKPKGHYQLYFADASGVDTPPSAFEGVELAVKHTTGAPERVVFKIDEALQIWTAESKSSDTSIAGASLTYQFLDIPITTEIPFATAVHAEFHSEPKVVNAGKPSDLVLKIKNFFDETVSTLDIVHEKQIHLMVVSQDLSEFYHIHPEPSGGVFRVAHTFPHGGIYKLFADYQPPGGSGRIEAFDLKVAGARRAPVPLLAPTADGPQTSIVGGVKIVLSATKPLRTGEDIGLAMALCDAKTNAPVQNLQPYLAAWAHIAIVSEDQRDFIHVHPIEDAATAPAGSHNPPAIHATAGFRKPGLYKMWVQVQRNGQVASVPFVLRVAEGGNAMVSQAQVPPGAILVKVSSSGYEPALIPANAGKPLKLAFFRQDAENCGKDVLFPDLGIQRELPVGQTVVIDITPVKTGSLTFSCGMKMLHGELLVR
jgi:hypothetical protein